MKKLLTLLLGLSISTTAIAEPTAEFQTISIEDGLDRNETRVRSAAVKITDGSGHGSGGIVQYYDLQLILTAQHVANSRIGSEYFVINGSTMERAILVYSGFHWLPWPGPFCIRTPLRHPTKGGTPPPWWQKGP